jgi:hypothetical protein
VDLRSHTLSSTSHSLHRILSDFRSQVTRPVLLPLFRPHYIPLSHDTTRSNARNNQLLTSRASLVMKMKTTLLLAALLAAPLSAIADDVVVWTTIVQWVGPGGTPIAAPVGNSQAVGVQQAGDKAVEHQNNPAPAPTTSATPPPAAAPVVNEKVALKQGGGSGGQQGQQGQPGDQPQNTQPHVPPPSSTTPASVSPPAQSSPPSGGSNGGSSSGGGEGGFSEGTCTGAGTNIFWTGDEVNYTVTLGASKGVTGTTKGCLNLGEPGSNVDIAGIGGTLFEGNWQGGENWFDISFIPGFTVPVVCKAHGKKSGCSIDLFSQGTPCPSGGDGKICKNPIGAGGSKDPGGYSGSMGEPWCWACSAPDPFFQPCAAAGYTFPLDDDATQNAPMKHGDPTITCCVGTSCGHTGREGNTAKTGHPQPQRPCTVCSNNQASKRGLEAVIGQPQPMTPSLLPRKHKRHQHQHRHAAAHEAKKH